MLITCELTVLFLGTYAKEIRKTVIPAILTTLKT